VLSRRQHNHYGAGPHRSRVADTELQWSRGRCRPRDCTARRQRGVEAAARVLWFRLAVQPGSVLYHRRGARAPVSLAGNQRASSTQFGRNEGAKESPALAFYAVYVDRHKAALCPMSTHARNGRAYQGHAGHIRVATGRVAQCDDVEVFLRLLSGASGNGRHSNIICSRIYWDRFHLHNRCRVRLYRQPVVWEQYNRDRGQGGCVNWRRCRRWHSAEVDLRH
jgi:hypothetical protein